MKYDIILTNVFRAYFDARKHKRNTLNQLNFEFNLEENLVALYRDIRERRYHVGKSVCFVVDHPVIREIFAADFRDRVVHHLIYNDIAPQFERRFIEDSYACRKGYGTLMGIERMGHHIRSCTDNYSKQAYILKLDIQGYFMSINRKILYDKLEKTLLVDKGRVADNTRLDLELILFLIKEVIFDDPTKNCIICGEKQNWDELPASKSLFHAAPDCGLPIGNLTSQLFSNIYMNDFDHYVKRVLGVKHYGRYVDDFFLIHQDKYFLLSCKDQIEHYLKQSLGLTLHPQKIYLQEAAKGVIFLGAVIKPYRRYVKKKTKHKISRTFCRLNYLVEEERESLTKKDLYTIRAIVNSYEGYLAHFNAFRLKQSLLKRCPALFDISCNRT
jgi:RNA-directed DNA polymerase